MGHEQKNSRLPPPAFPPGARKAVQGNSKSPKRELQPEALPELRAFISPDDPIPKRRPPEELADAIEGAIISPEDPIPPRGEGGVVEEGVVTSMGFDPHMEPEELASGGDPYVMEVVEVVRKLAEALKWQGEAGLRTSPAMSRFEATLRGYCVGYLAGRRAEEEAERAELYWRAPPKDDIPDF